MYVSVVWPFGYHLPACVYMCMLVLSLCWNIYCGSQGALWNLPLCLGLCVFTCEGHLQVCLGVRLLVCAAMNLREFGLCVFSRGLVSPSTWA